MNKRSSDRVSADTIAAHGLKVLTFAAAAKSDCGATWCDVGARVLVFDGKDALYVFRPIVEKTLSEVRDACDECRSGNHSGKHRNGPYGSVQPDADEIVCIFDDETVVNLESNLPDES